MRAWQQFRLALAFLVALGAACHDGPTAPHSGTIRVSVQTSGGDFDLDGYELVVGPDVRRQLIPRDTVRGSVGTQRFELEIPGIAAGVRSVTLSGLAANCSVTGDAQQSATVAAGRTVDIAFAVVCAATGLAITTHTTGSDNPLPYTLRVDQSSSSIAANGALTIGRFEPGVHTVSIDAHADNCTVVGGSQRTITVASGMITPVAFEITCLPVSRLEKIAYVVDTAANGESARWIMLVNPNGSGAKTLAVGESPAWSPSGSSLAFSTTVCSADDEYEEAICSGGLVVMDPETLNMVPLTAGGRGFTPAWAPTGDVIAFTRCCEGSDLTRLFLARLDGSPSVSFNIPEVRLVRDPTWSPDGRRIAFTCFTGELSTDVCVVNRDGSGFARLTTDGAVKGDPAWSPEGSVIAFTRYTAESSPEIVLVTSDGKRVTRLTDGKEPAWSRDSATLIFDGGVGLYTINVDGSHRTRLTVGGQQSPAWRP